MPPLPHAGEGWGEGRSSLIWNSQGVEQQGTEVSILFCDKDSEHWRTAWCFNVFDQTAVWALGFGAVYINADYQGRIAVYSVDLRDPDLTRHLILSDRKHDIEGALRVDSVTGEAVGVTGAPINGDDA